MYLCRGKDTEANEWENVEIKGNGPLIIYRRGKWLEVFFNVEGGYHIVFGGNGGYKSSLTEVKGEAIDRKLTANEEGSQQIKTTS